MYTRVLLLKNNDVVNYQAVKISNILYANNLSVFTEKS